MLRDDLVLYECGAERRKKCREEFDINLLILDHSWLNEIDTHKVLCELSRVCLDKIDRVERNEQIEDLSLEFTTIAGLSLQMSH